MHRVRRGLLLLFVLAPTARAGDHARRVVARPAYPSSTVVVEQPRSVVTPNGITEAPALGTFYADPSIVDVSGSPGIAYSPAGVYREAGSLSIYGPLSRFRARPAEATVYERGYGGGLQPAGSVTVFTYPGMNPLQPNPDTYRLRDYGGPRRSVDFTPGGRPPFVLGQY